MWFLKWTVTELSLTLERIRDLALPLYNLNQFIWKFLFIFFINTKGKRWKLSSTHLILCAFLWIWKVKIGLRVLTRPLPEKLPTIYRTLGENFNERVLPSIIHETLKAVVAQYNASQLITQREVTFVPLCHFNFQLTKKVLSNLFLFICFEQFSTFSCLQVKTWDNL